MGKPETDIWLRSMSEKLGNWSQKRSSELSKYLLQLSISEKVDKE